MLMPLLRIWKSIRLGLIILGILVVYAYGVQVTKVSLNEFRNPTRQQSRIRVMRALARPEIFEYEKEEFHVYTPIWVPCPARASTPTPSQPDEPYVVLVPPCGNPGEKIQVEGYHFEPNTEGPINFIPSSDPSYAVALQRGKVQTDAEGHFIATIVLPERPSDEVQYIRITTRRNVGLPRLSKTAYETWDKIVETVFLALLATTLGTLLALPVSFLAARNLMRDVKSPLSSIALSILGVPLGFLLGIWLASWVSRVGQMVNANLGLTISSVAVSPLILYRAMRWALPQEEGSVRLTLKVLRIIVLFFISAFVLLTFYLLAALLMRGGSAIIGGLGKLAFLGNFIIQCGDILMTGLPAITALAGGLVASSVANRFGQLMIERFSMTILKSMNLLLAPLAGATLFTLLGAGINWLYEINDPLSTFWLPLGVGVALGVFLALRTKPKDALPIGIYIYYVTRTILNAVRSIEALIMAIVAVIWVGIGPFAGVLALGLHTVAALAKLYSEQIESILPGPIEAVQATGANRLQTIIYAVVPQIIPPYISFTMYRWDINVRMSTIIGFAGGGGIGFLLQQNINLLNYRAASTQMLAIAIVVATMDYISSTLREKFV